MIFVLLLAQTLLAPDQVSRLAPSQVIRLLASQQISPAVVPVTITVCKPPLQKWSCEPSGSYQSWIIVQTTPPL
jgi:hypothetical protein